MVLLLSFFPAMRSSSLSHRLLILLCLLLFFGLALQTALAKSPTVDEPVHLLRGYLLWHTADLRLQTQPPLSHWLMGSLLWTEPSLPDPTQFPIWETGDRIQIGRTMWWQSGVNVDRVFLLGRLPMIWLGMLLGAMAITWARQWTPPGQIRRWGSVTAVILFAFSSNIIAFSSLATTDLTVAATYTAVLFAWFLYQKRPTRLRWLLVGLALGLALGAKLTAFLLPPLLLLLNYARWRRGDAPWWQPALRWAGWLPLAGLVLWSLYRFEIGITSLAPFPLPAPTYLANFLRAQEHIGGGHEAFLLGERSARGWWHYFLLAFLLKTPPVTLLLLALGLIGIVSRPKRWRETAVFWLPAGALFAVASYTRLNIGYRHILLILPLVWLLGVTAVRDWLRRDWPRGLLILLLGFYVWGALRQHPHHLAYFTPFIGGSDNGYRYLGDSNLDWGQDLKYLTDYLADHPDTAYSYFGSADPAYYGLPPGDLLTSDGVPQTLHPANPTPGHYAISASHLQGLRLEEPDAFDWFRRRQPVETIGHSILVYEVKEQATGDWAAFCLDPGPLLSPTAVSDLLGRSDLRGVYFDCRGSWVFPDDGAPGWYILPRQESWPAATAFSDHLEPVYTHAPTPHLPSFEIYHWDGAGSLADYLAAQQGPASLPDGTSLSWPVPVGDVAQLEGYWRRDGAWVTAWRATAEAPPALTIAAHLYDESAPPPQVSDGLGVASEQWRPGDRIWQTHRFETEGDGRSGNASFLETGLYNYLSGERLPVAGRSGPLIRLR